MTPAMAIQYNSGYGESSGDGINDMMNGWLDGWMDGSVELSSFFWGGGDFYEMDCVSRKIVLVYLLFYDDV